MYGTVAEATFGFSKESELIVGIKTTMLDF
jgi:hypothetical protein